MVLQISTTEKKIQPLPRNIKLMAQLTLVMSPTSFGIAHSPPVSSLIWIFWVKRALLRWSRSFNPHLLSIAFVVNCIACTCTGGAFPHRGGAGAAHGDPNLGPKHCDPQRPRGCSCRPLLWSPVVGSYKRNGPTRCSCVFCVPSSLIQHINYMNYFDSQTR